MLMITLFMESIDDLKLSLQGSPKQLFKLFADNQVNSSSDKFYLIVNTDDVAEIQIGDSNKK